MPASYMRKVYPRPRGGTIGGCRMRRYGRGLSPPTRGNLGEEHVQMSPVRSIPAHAGEPQRQPAVFEERPVYPRPRGGTRDVRRDKLKRRGLSPPTRGNLSESMRDTWARRSIPAHAGEPARSATRSSSSEVYPRPRGGTPKPPESRRIAEGLSPPTRGNHAGIRPPGRSSRSIPAHAGEPRSRRSSSLPPTVYPRPRGGTLRRAWDWFGALGLSPPTRGNPKAAGRARRRPRSIPAHAGEPKNARKPAWRSSVYPRPRGGTPQNAHLTARWAGLSPPTRGNLAIDGEPDMDEGSIPAHAGEPPPAAALCVRAEVYPRPRGGTRRFSFARKPNRGLSPPTRGNLARASGCPHFWTVYPRPRGGTYDIREIESGEAGLSPPTRGNPATSPRVPAAERSIPAHAGEPFAGGLVATAATVYPRPRGGTTAGLAFG